MSGLDDGGHRAAYTRVLEVRVEEATGYNKDSERIWDADITEGFIKAEVRASAPGAKPLKQVTKTVKVSSDAKMTWKQPLYLDLSDTSSELRLLLCREKESGGKRSINVITACGIFVNDILDAAPIDKYFEMFKPGSGKEGGFVRLKMALLTPEQTQARQQDDGKSNKKSRLRPLLACAATVAAALFVLRKQRKKQSSSSL